MPSDRENTTADSKEKRTMKKFLSLFRKHPILCSITLIFSVLLFSIGLFMPVDCTKNTGWASCICYFFGTDAKASVLDRIGIIIAFCLSAWGIFIAYRRAETIEKRRSQERFRDAIEHLGNDSESVRMGGGYALFKLAIEEEEMRESIAQILCSHIREVTSDSRYMEIYSENPSSEIQSLMNLLFRQSQESQHFWAYERKGLKFWADLSQGYFCGLAVNVAQFQRADLSNAQFQRADLWNAQFQEANLPNAQFQEANLSAAQFQRADLWNAQFQGAILPYAQFQKSELSKAQFQDALLSHAQFQGTNLTETKFQKAVLADAIFQKTFTDKSQSKEANSVGIQFQEATLSRAQFQGATLHNAQFQGATLNEAEFQGAYLPAAQFQGAILCGAQFQLVDLSDARFQGSNLHKAQFQGAILKNVWFHGALLGLAEFQGADFGNILPGINFEETLFHGVDCSKYMLISPFKINIEERIGKNSDVRGICFYGGLTNDKIKEFVQALEGFRAKDTIEKFQKEMGNHVNHKEENRLPDGAHLGSYSAQDADSWIQKYEEATK